MSADEGRVVVIPMDPINEQVIIAAACVDPEQRHRMVKLFTPDQFQVDKHQAAWRGFVELERRKLMYDPATLQTLSADIDIGYLVQLEQTRPEVPPNLDHHIELLRWDHTRATAARGPVAKFIDAMHDSRSAPETVRAYARQVGQAFEGFDDRRYLHDSKLLAATQTIQIEKRSEGHAIYQFGLPGLDFYEPVPPSTIAEPRLIPGAAPSMVTVITGVPGSGKTTLTARIALGLARQRRKVLYGAWEVGAGMNLELLAAMSLGWSRSRLLKGRSQAGEGRITADELATIRSRMEVIGEWVTFMSNPFNRRMGEKPSNERNLDIIQGYIEATGCDVFIADLWKRCLRKTDPDEEEHALIRQQAIAEETRCHCILVQQQRAKDIEGRPDKRPTREGVKGSGAWTEVADNMIGVHRPALWKNIPDHFVELFVLKQRWALWPIGVECEWDADTGTIGAGRSIPYDQPGQQASNASDPFSGEFQAPTLSSKRKKKT